MSRGKYSIKGFKDWPEDYEYKFNCYGELPEEWLGQESRDAGKTFNSLTMFGEYDEEGYDFYGYSAFDAEGNFVGHGDGIDRAGWTENDYLLELDERS